MKTFNTIIGFYLIGTSVFFLLTFCVNQGLREPMAYWDLVVHIFPYYLVNVGLFALMGLGMFVAVRGHKCGYGDDDKK